MHLLLLTEIYTALSSSKTLLAPGGRKKELTHQQATHPSPDELPLCAMNPRTAIRHLAARNRSQPYWKAENGNLEISSDFPNLPSFGIAQRSADRGGVFSPLGESLRRQLQKGLGPPRQGTSCERLPSTVSCWREAVKDLRSCCVGQVQRVVGTSV
jgi:hypothetical protein